LGGTSVELLSRIQGVEKKIDYFDKQYEKLAVYFSEDPKKT
jgi:hypothetical protein